MKKFVMEWSIFFIFLGVIFYFVNLNQIRRELYSFRGFPVYFLNPDDQNGFSGVYSSLIKKPKKLDKTDFGMDKSQFTSRLAREQVYGNWGDYKSIAEENGLNSRTQSCRVLNDYYRPYPIILSFRYITTFASLISSDSYSVIVFIPGKGEYKIDCKEFFKIWDKSVFFIPNRPFLYR